MRPVDPLYLLLFQRITGFLCCVVGLRSLKKKPHHWSLDKKYDQNNDRLRNFRQFHHQIKENLSCSWLVVVANLCQLHKAITCGVVTYGFFLELNVLTHVWGSLCWVDLASWLQWRWSHRRPCVSVRLYYKNKKIDMCSCGHNNDHISA